jgi:hypothetical protein
MTSRDAEPAQLSWRQVCARRLRGQRLTEQRPGDSPADVVAAMCGAQAQVMSAAELSVGLRMAGGTRADVRAALWQDRSLVKTYGPRGTVHLLPARDLPMWLAALAAIPVRPDPAGRNDWLTPEQTSLVVEAVGAALTSAAPAGGGSVGGGSAGGGLAGAGLTVDELDEQVVRATGSWAADLVVPAFGGMAPRWRLAISAAASSGVLCYGPSRGRKTSYVHLPGWLPGFVAADEAQALVELVTRFLRVYGPATSAQFAQWLGAPRRWAAELFDSMAGLLRSVRVGDTRAWLPAQDPGAAVTEPGGVLLLPYFDAYLIGSHPRELLFPGVAGERALARGQAGNFPVLVIDGTVAGLWHHRRSGGTVSITVEPFAGLSRSQCDEVRAQADRIGVVLQARARVTFGPVTIGAHA